MEAKYTIRQYDNGWTLEDSRSLAKHVLQEKLSDKEHGKFKHTLGEWLYDDLECFFSQIGSTECEIEVKFKKVDKEEE